MFENSSFERIVKDKCEPAVTEPNFVLVAKHLLAQTWDGSTFACKGIPAKSKVATNRLESMTCFASELPDHDSFKP